MTEERVEELAEKAAALHRSGYNCAQAVACALSGEVGVDEDLCFRLMEALALEWGRCTKPAGPFPALWLLLVFETARAGKILRRKRLPIA